MQLSQSFSMINKKVIAIVGTLLGAAIIFGMSASAGATSSHWQHHGGHHNNRANYGNSHCVWRWSDHHGQNVKMRYNWQSHQWEKCHYDQGNHGYHWYDSHNNSHDSQNRQHQQHGMQYQQHGMHYQHQY